MFDVTGVLGQGAFSEVVLLSAEDGEELAAKVIQKENTKQNEMILWPNLKHENIVPLLGFQCTPYKDVFFMPVCEGTMHQILQDKEFRQDPSSFEATVQWLKDVACGLEYLHYQEIHHLDLKPKNVLIKYDRRRAMICDMGHTNKSKQLVDRYGLINFSPPESWNFTDNCKSRIDGESFDLWCFGVLALRCWRDTFPETGFRMNRWDWKMKEYPKLHKMLQLPELSDSLSKCFPRSSISDVDSVLAMNFLKGILKFFPVERPQATQILEHRIFFKSVPGTVFEPDAIWYKEETEADSAAEKKVRYEEFKESVRGQLKNVMSQAKDRVTLRRMPIEEFYEFIGVNKGEIQTKKRRSLKKRMSQWIFEKCTATKNLFRCCYRKTKRMPTIEIIGDPSVYYGP